MRLQIQTIVSMPFAENSYVVWQEGRADAVLIGESLMRATRPSAKLRELIET